MFLRKKNEDRTIFIHYKVTRVNIHCLEGKLSDKTTYRLFTYQFVWLCLIFDEIKRLIFKLINLVLWTPTRSGLFRADYQGLQPETS
jgi:hypothetical protein